MKFIRHTIILLLLSSGTCLADSDASSDTSSTDIRQSFPELLSFRCKGMSDLDYLVFFNASDGEANAGDASKALRSSNSVDIETQSENCTDITRIIKDSVDQDPQGITPHVANAAHALVSKREKGEAGIDWEFIPEQNRSVFFREVRSLGDFGVPDGGRSGALKTVQVQTLVIAASLAVTSLIISTNPFVLIPVAASVPVINHYFNGSPRIQQVEAYVLAKMLACWKPVVGLATSLIPSSVWKKLGYTVIEEVVKSTGDGTTSLDPAFQTLKDQ